MVYTNTDPHGPARKIAADLLSHWPHIFIVSGKGRPAYQRLIILQQRVNCKESSGIHSSSLNKKWGLHHESRHACECVSECVCRYGGPAQVEKESSSTTSTYLSHTPTVLPSALQSPHDV